MFTGFTEETAEFLWGIRFNNDRTWFQEHKEQYQRALFDPMKELADEMLRFLRKKRPKAPLYRKVTRIYRDARRLYGKGPYKDHLWFTVERPTDTAEGTAGKPVFWFEITPDGWSYGLGYWEARPVTMAKLRAEITRDPKPVERLTRRLNRNHEFQFGAELYRRPKGPAPSNVLEPWFRAKSFVILHEEASLTEELYSRALVERLEKGYTFLLPYYDYLAVLEAMTDEIPAGKPEANPEALPEGNPEELPDGNTNETQGGTHP